MVEEDPILKRAREILEDFPNTKIHPTSREFLHESPLDWSVSRNRLLQAAIRRGDQQAVDEIVDDVAHVVGRRNAEWWMLQTMGKIVEDELKKNRVDEDEESTSASLS